MISYASPPSTINSPSVSHHLCGANTSKVTHFLSLDVLSSVKYFICSILTHEGSTLNILFAVFLESIISDNVTISIRTEYEEPITSGRKKLCNFFSFGQPGNEYALRPMRGQPVCSVRRWDPAGRLQSDWAENVSLKKKKKNESWLNIFTKTVYRHLLLSIKITTNLHESLFSESTFKNFLKVARKPSNYHGSLFTLLQTMKNSLTKEGVVKHGSCQKAQGQVFQTEILLDDDCQLFTHYSMTPPRIRRQKVRNHFMLFEAQ